MNAVLKPVQKKFVPKNAKPAKGQAYKGKVEPIRMVPLYLTKREQMLTDAAKLGAKNFWDRRGSEYIPDPIKCDLDMMEAYQQGIAVACLNAFGTSRYIVG